MGKALDAEERLHVCFTINASIISVKHFACDLFHFRYLFKMRCNSLKCVIIFVVRKQVLCHYFNELSFFVVYKEIFVLCVLKQSRMSVPDSCYWFYFYSGQDSKKVRTIKNYKNCLSLSERGLHPTVRVEVNFTDFNLVGFECIS